MFKRLLLPAIVLAIIAVLAWFQLGYYFKSDEEKIKTALHGILQGARERQIGDMLSWVSERYKDRFHRDKQALHKTLLSMWSRYREVRVNLVGEPVVAIDGKDPNKATVTFHAVVLLGTTKGQPPTNTLVQDMRRTDFFVLECQKEGSIWRVIGTRAPDAPK